ncbi:hypothetical protein HEK616_20530 [Streptomyces nigrescens]|uniref:Uncharacterized protein n=1 Tax=Streptomyces nigrescens TaxID=1920 RepID=A0ABM7ZQV5_STRNI|nr:hypothetical protein HEK616_20530 [Streptomyces nigrescens]
MTVRAPRVNARPRGFTGFMHSERPVVVGLGHNEGRGRGPACRSPSPIPQASTERRYDDDSG